MVKISFKVVAPTKRVRIGDGILTLLMNRPLFATNPDHRVSLVYDYQTSGYRAEEASNFSKTAFNELRVSEPTPQAHIQFNYNINTGIVSTNAYNNATITGVSGLAKITTSGINSSGIIQSKDFVYYFPGQGNVIRFSAMFNSGQSGSKQLIGIGDELDGLFWGYSGAEFGVLRKRNDIEHWTLQSSFNRDKLDSTSQYNFNIDPTKANVYQITYQWLGFGIIDFSVEPSNSLGFKLAHRIEYPNNNNETSINTPHLPLCIYAENTTYTGKLNLASASMGGFLDGREIFIGLNNSASSSKTLAANSPINLLTIKSATTYQGQKNRIGSILTLTSSANDGTKPVKYDFYKNSTITGSSFINADSQISAISYDTQGIVTSSGVRLFGYIEGKNLSNFTLIKELAYKLNPGETITCVAQSSAASDVFLNLGWEELF